MATKAELEQQLAEMREQLAAAKGGKSTAKAVPTWKSTVRDAIDNPVKSGAIPEMVKIGVRTRLPKGIHGALTLHVGIADDRDAPKMAEALMTLAEYYATK